MTISQRMAVPIFVNKIFRGHLAERSEPLRAPRPHPDKISGGDRIPRIAQPVNPAAFEHDQPMFHHVHFDHAERRSRLVHHGVYGEVETHLIRKQTFDLQAGIISEGCDDTASSLDTISRGGSTEASVLVGLFDHRHAACLRGSHAMLQPFGQIGIAAHAQFALFALKLPT